MDGMRDNNVTARALSKETAHHCPHCTFAMQKRTVLRRSTINIKTMSSFQDPNWKRLTQIIHTYILLTSLVLHEYLTEILGPFVRRSWQHPK